MNARGIIDGLWYKTSALGETVVPFTSDEAIQIYRLVDEFMGGNRQGAGAYYIDDLIFRQYGVRMSINAQEFQREVVKHALETGHELKPLFGVMGANSWVLVKTDRGWLTVRMGPSSVTLKPDTKYHGDLNIAFQEFVRRQDEEPESERPRRH